MIKLMFYFSICSLLAVAKPVSPKVGKNQKIANILTSCAEFKGAEDKALCIFVAARKSDRLKKMLWNCADRQIPSDGYWAGTEKCILAMHEYECVVK